jgi:hypothetical protein
MRSYPILLKNTTRRTTKVEPKEEKTHAAWASD